MDDVKRMTIAATLRRCRGQICRPPGVTGQQVADAMEAGFLKFHEWPSGHFQITDAGREFLAENAA